ncbi:MAG: HEAT repeat domain-containing protein [Gammaproteobacteria bacterium]|nr:HEAT repeat domain-containing protein [Gammaproteobacteria bacterium]
MKRVSVVVAFCVVIGAVIFTYALLKSDAAPLLYKFEVGQSYYYALDYSSEGQGALSPNLQGGSNPAGLTESSTAKIVGQVILKILEKKPAGFYSAEFKIVPSAFAFQYNHKEAAVRPAYIVALIEILDNWAINNFSMEPSAYESYGSVVREILGLLELKFPAERALTWQGMEKQFPNEIPVTFALKGEKLSSSYEISKSYVGGSGSPKIEGAFDYKFDNRAGLVRYLNGERKSEFRIAGQVLSINKTSLKMSYVESKQHGTNAGSLGTLSTASSGGLVKDTLVGEKLVQDLKEASHKNTLGNDNLKTLLAALSMVNRTDGNALAQLGQKISALLFLHPELAREFANLLLQYDWQDGRRLTIAAALTDVGTKEAQEALLSVLRQLPENGKSQVNLLFNLAMVKNPIVAAEDYFREAANTSAHEQLRIKSDFALGIIAHNVMQTEPQRAQNILGELTANLQTTNTIGQQIVLIDSIGNIGMPEQVSVLKPYLENSNNAVKLPAINALRFVDTPDSKGLLINYMKSDDERVRDVAAQSLGVTPGGRNEFELYKERLFQEKSIPVLKHILNNLAKLDAYSPDNLNTIDSFIRQCGHPDICGYAKSLRAMFEKK